MLSWSAKADPDTTCLTTWLVPFDHLMDCTGTGVEHVMVPVSPSLKILFPLIIIAECIKWYAGMHLQV